jgi:hypothetical protein
MLHMGKVVLCMATCTYIDAVATLSILASFNQHQIGRIFSFCTYTHKC